MNNNQNLWEKVQKNKNKILLRRFHGWMKNDDGTVIIDIKGVHKFVFNNVAAKFWDLIDEDRTFQEIVDELYKNAGEGTDKQFFTLEVFELAEQLIQNDLIDWEQSLWDVDEPSNIFENE